MITTDVIKTSRNTYARAALYRLAGRWWWVVVAPMFLFAIASFWDASYIFGALIWLFLVLPPGLMFAYYNYLLKPASAALMRPHRVVFGPDRNVTIKFEPDEEEIPVYEDVYLPGDMLKTVIERGDSFEFIYHKGSPIDILVVPYSSLTPEDAALLTREYLNI